MSVYAVDKVARQAVIDEQFRQRLRDDPDGVLASVRPPLRDTERRWLAAGDVVSLSRAGATHFLLTQLARLELFGLTIELYGERMRAGYAKEREEMRAAGTLPD
jgi:hypothetical protein